MASLRTSAKEPVLRHDFNLELFIFDVDPPPAGITNCLEQLRDSHPKARASNRDRDSFRTPPSGVFFGGLHP